MKDKTRATADQQTSIFCKVVRLLTWSGGLLRHDNNPHLELKRPISAAVEGGGSSQGKAPRTGHSFPPGE